MIGDPTGRPSDRAASVIDTADLDEAAAALGRTFPRVEIAADPDGRPFRLRHSRIDCGMVTRTVLSVQGRFHAFGEFPEHIAVGRRLIGAPSIRYDAGALDTDRPYLRAPGWSDARLDDSEVELVMFERDAFLASARRHLEGSGRELLEPSLARSSPLSPVYDQLWKATGDVLARAMGDESAIVEGMLEELAVAAVLAVFPLTEARTQPTGVAVLPRVIRRATDFMRERLDQPITVADIAAAAGVSVRTLQAGFRRHLGTAPHQYLRLLRLEAVRGELRSAEPGSTSVAETAGRFGFRHLSRFAGAYRREFGEYPAETLRR